MTSSSVGAERVTGLAANVGANFIGKIWTGLIGLAVIPIYVRLLGVETYGLIGVFSTLQGMTAFLDLGLGVTCSRELARNVGSRSQIAAIRDTLRTVEVIFWSTGIAIAIAVAGSASLISENWIKSQDITSGVIGQAIVLMGIAIGLQWPGSLYTGGLMGIERQVTQNIVAAGFATARHLGCVIVLLSVGPTVHVFFAWQILIGVTQSVSTGVLLWWYLPKADRRARFSLTQLRNIWRFALGMTTISILAIAVTQADKIVVSKLVLLKSFGYYMLAWNASTVLWFVITPISSALLPRLSRLVATDSKAELVPTYHLGCQMMSALVWPIVTVGFLFSEELLAAWTGSPGIAAQTSLMFRMFLLGLAFGAIAEVPYVLQLAHGWTTLGIAVRGAATALIVPLLIVSIDHFGAQGASYVWVFNNALLLVGVVVMHQKILRGQLLRWWTRDVVIPAVASIASVNLVKLLLGSRLDSKVSIVQAFVCGFCGVVGAILVSSDLRRQPIFERKFKWPIRLAWR